MYIDTHCHLSLEDYDDIDMVIQENREAGIDKIIISGCTMESIIESIQYAHEYDNVNRTQMWITLTEDIPSLKNKLLK